MLTVSSVKIVPIKTVDREVCGLSGLTLTFFLERDVTVDLFPIKPLLASENTCSCVIQVK